MKEQLELKHLAPYLPYGVEIYNWDGGYEKPLTKCHLIGIDGDQIIISSYTFKSIHCGNEVFNRPKMNTSPSITKLVLRPLYDLTKEIEHKGERFVPIEKISEMYGIDIMIDGQKTLIAPITLEPYNVIRQLFEWHFDVFGLIYKGLAIDINSLTP